MIALIYAILFFPMMLALILNALPALLLIGLFIYIFRKPLGWLLFFVLLLLDLLTAPVAPVIRIFIH